MAGLGSVSPSLAPMILQRGFLSGRDAKWQSDATVESSSSDDKKAKSWMVTVFLPSGESGGRAQGPFCHRMNHKKRHLSPGIHDITEKIEDFKAEQSQEKTKRAPLRGLPQLAQSPVGREFLQGEMRPSNGRTQSEGGGGFHWGTRASQCSDWNKQCHK